MTRPDWTDVVAGTLAVALWGALLLVFFYKGDNS